jgi:hypothetical protein
MLCRYGTTTDPPVSDNICNNIWLPGVGTFILNLAVTSECISRAASLVGCQLACTLCRLHFDSDRWPASIQQCLLLLLTSAC